MSIVNGAKIATLVSAANGDTYGDAQRHFFRTIQVLLQANVKSMALTTAPASPSNGDTYVVAGIGGAWSTATIGQIAYWAVDAQDGVVSAGAWEFYTPLAGWRVYDNNTGGVWAFSGTVWLPSATLKTTVVATATTALNPATANSFRINLNNVAAVTLNISNGLFDGQDLTLLWVQGATTGSTVTFGANIHGGTTPSAPVNSVSSQRFTWDATNSIWYALAAAVTGM